MKHTLSLLAALLLALPAILHATGSPPDQSAAMRLHLPGAITNSMDAIPLGNGLSGGLNWGKGTSAYLSLDRGDWWDLRPHPSDTSADLNHQTAVEMARCE